MFFFGVPRKVFKNCTIAAVRSACLSRHSLNVVRGEPLNVDKEHTTDKQGDRKSLQNVRSVEYTELYQTARRLILDFVGGNERKDRTCFSLSEAITQTYLLLRTSSAATTAF